MSWRPGRAAPSSSKQQKFRDKCFLFDHRSTNPRIERQTFPLRYKFGLKRTVLFPVVIKRQRGARIGLKKQMIEIRMTLIETMSLTNPVDNG